MTRPTGGRGAREYLRDWPAHRHILAAFDASLADVPVPPAAAPAARAMRHCVEFADTLDSTRLEAAQRGERAWQREVAAEAEVESAPSIAARNAAGFAARATLADPTAPPRVGARPRVDRGR